MSFSKALWGNPVMIVSVSKTVWVDPVINIMHKCLSVRLCGGDHVVIVSVSKTLWGDPVINTIQLCPKSETFVYPNGLSFKDVLYNAYNNSYFPDQGEFSLGFPSEWNRI